MSGVTTMTSGGTGPWHIHSMPKAAESFTMNLGFQGKGDASLPSPFEEQVEAGAYGLKLHEDWGTAG